jgi:serine/threonine-protein kinase
MPVIADFGIAEAPVITDGDKKEVFCTVQYFSPEQAKGEKTDRRTDIYSMGVILYEMMVGELPFNGEDSVAIALKHLHQAPVPPVQKDPSLPESLNRIILKAMRKEKGRRYQTMAEMQKDLELCLEEPGGEYIEGYEESGKTRAGRRRKKRSFAIFAGAVAVLLVLIAAFVIMNTLGLFSSKQSSQVYVPSLKDKTVEEVEAALSNLGLTPEYIYQANGEVEEGRVVSQSPDMGSLVNRGDTVTLVVSKGTKSVKELPSLVGMGEEEALRMLYDTGFMDISINYVQQEEIPNNQIVSQSPGAGESVSTDSSITITINHFGDAQFKNITSFVGKSVEEALDEAKSSGFENVHITISDVNDTSGKVISQFPTPDMTEAYVSTIYLTIARLSGSFFCLLPFVE